MADPCVRKPTQPNAVAAPIKRSRTSDIATSTPSNILSQLYDSEMKVHVDYEEHVERMTEYANNTYIPDPKVGIIEAKPGCSTGSETTVSVIEKVSEIGPAYNKMVEGLDLGATTPTESINLISEDSNSSTDTSIISDSPPPPPTKKLKLINAPPLISAKSIDRTKCIYKYVKGGRRGDTCTNTASKNSHLCSLHTKGGEQKLSCQRTSVEVTEKLRQMETALQAMEDKIKKLTNEVRILRNEKKKNKKEHSIKLKNMSQNCEYQVIKISQNKEVATVESTSGRFKVKLPRSLVIPANPSRLFFNQTHLKFEFV